MPHVGQSCTPLRDLSGGDSHNVGMQAVERDPCSESLQGSGALVPGSPKHHWQRGKVALQGECTPPRGALPVQAKPSQNLGHDRHAGKAEGRGVGQLVKEMTSQEDPSEDVEGLLRGSAEGTQNEANSLIEYELGTRTEGMVLARGGPQLTAIGKDRKADRIEDKVPVSHGEATMCVTKDLEGLEGSMGSVAHGRDVSQSRQK